MARARALAGIAALLLALPLAPPVPAQDGLSMGQVQSPVLTINVDRLLAETLYGQRLSAELNARVEALAAENREIEAELTAEEQSLTERRPGMDADAFRAEAEAFDAKVQRIRAEQDSKEAALEAALAGGRDTFLNAATPALGRLMIDSGAAVILERREVFLSASVVDVTDEAIEAIDEALGAEGPPAAPAAEEEGAEEGEAAPGGG